MPEDAPIVDDDFDDIECTAIDNDWGDSQPNILMHPPCSCSRCAPQAASPVDDASWLQIPGQQHRLRVEPAALGTTGHELLG